MRSEGRGRTGNRAGTFSKPSVRGCSKAVTSSEVLQEVLLVRARRTGPDDGRRAVRSAAGLVADVLPVSGGDVLAACDLLKDHPRLNARDAVHAAVMKAHGLQIVISLDRDFDAIPGLVRVAPQDAI